MCYTLATISQCFLLSVFFNRANLAACGSFWKTFFFDWKLSFSHIAGAGILYFLLYLPYTILINYDTQTKTWQKVISVRKTANLSDREKIVLFQCFSSTVAFGLGSDYIARFEGMAQGIQWSNINLGARPNDNFSFLSCLIMMFVDSIIYMIATIYIENVFPGLNSALET